ncbi:MAG: helix-turn-helix transcriptional regulator [Victivallales bacterium]|nr:helix-turn-helix transcriptional regulator [Victivallales bacterium]
MGRALPGIQLFAYGMYALREWKMPISPKSLWRFYWHSGEGGYLLLPDREPVPMCPDKCYLIPAWQFVGCTNDRVIEQFHIDFELEEPFFCQGLAPFYAFPAEHFIPRIQKAFETPDVENIRLHSILFEALVLLHEERSRSPIRKSMDPRIARVLTYCQSLLANDIDSRKLSNRELSKVAQMSLDNFQHLFERQMGISPHQHTLHCRLLKAQALLRRTEATMDEIAERCGFKKRNQFSKAFSAVFHLPPVAFRRQVRALPARG